MEHLLPASFFEWCVATPVARWINASTWAFAALETFHIIGLTVLLGSILVVDLRLLGLGVRRQPVAQLAREVGPWILTGLAINISTGVPMFLSQAISYSRNVPFLVKMTLLLAGTVLQWMMHRKATRSGVHEGAGFARLAAGLSLICWFAVAYAGRAISFEILFGV